MIDYFIYIILFISILNLVFILMLSNFIIKLADSTKSFSKDLEDFYYLKNNSNKQKEEGGLVDI